MQYVSKHTLHIKTTCVNTSFITAYHSVWAYQPIAIRRFLGGRKDYHPKPCDLLNSCEKKSSLLWVSLSIIHNRVDKVIRIAPMGSVRGNRQGRKKFATNPMGICFYRSVFPWITCCPCSLFVHQPQLVAQYTHTHTHAHTHTQKLWASICMLRSCTNKDQTILIGPCLWHSSGCLYCNFLPGLIHVLSTVIPPGLWDAFIMQEHQLRLWGKCKGGLLFCSSHQT